MIKHVSFDVWNTLIKPNPEYAINRTKLIAETFSLDELFVKETYTKTKQRIDFLAENEGIGYSTDTVFNCLFENLNVKTNTELRSKVEKLFLQYPPIILDEVKYTINYLKKSNITISIGSNSNFISGIVMLPFLQKELGKFNFSVFSDLTLVSKPHTIFFEQIIKQVDFKANKSEILHVGDSEICDIFGAEKIGIKSFLIDNPKNITKILEII